MQQLGVFRLLSEALHQDHRIHAVTKHCFQWALLDKKANGKGLSPSRPPTKDVCLAFIEIDRSIAHRSQHLHRSRHNTYTVRATTLTPFASHTWVVQRLLQTSALRSPADPATTSVHGPWPVPTKKHLNSNSCWSRLRIGHTPRNMRSAGRTHVACCTGNDGRTHVACCTGSHKSQTDWHILIRLQILTFCMISRGFFTHFSFCVKLKTTRTETTTSTMRQTVAFGFMFTYCDAHGIKQICLLHLRVFFGPRGAGTLWTLLQSVCPVIRNLKQ